ncbi:unnamed protein product, partial [Linum tenue]
QYHPLRAKPGCSSELPGVEALDAQLIHIKVWFNWIGFSTRKGKLTLKFLRTDNELIEHQHGTTEISKSMVDDSATTTEKPEIHSSFSVLAKETLKVAIIHFSNKWHRRLSFIWRHILHVAQSFQKLWNITGISLNLDVPKWLRILHLDRANTHAGFKKARLGARRWRIA